MRTLILGAVVLLPGPLLAAEQSPACLAKRAEIENGIAAAEARGNAREAKGLRRALQANKDHCTTASLEVERARDIADAWDEVAERRAELEEARREGDAEEIAKRRAKLEEALTELREAQEPLPR